MFFVENKKIQVNFVHLVSTEEGAAFTFLIAMELDTSDDEFLRERLCEVFRYRIDDDVRADIATAVRRPLPDEETALQEVLASCERLLKRGINPSIGRFLCQRTLAIHATLFLMKGGSVTDIHVFSMNKRTAEKHSQTMSDLIARIEATKKMRLSSLSQ